MWTPYPGNRDARAPPSVLQGWTGGRDRLMEPQLALSGFFPKFLPWRLEKHFFLLLWSLKSSRWFDGSLYLSYSPSPQFCLLPKSGSSSSFLSVSCYSSNLLMDSPSPSPFPTDFLPNCRSSFSLPLSQTVLHSTPIFFFLSLFVFQFFNFTLHLDFSVHSRFCLNR